VVVSNIVVWGFFPGNCYPDYHEKTILSGDRSNTYSVYISKNISIFYYIFPFFQYYIEH